MAAVSAEMAVLSPLPEAPEALVEEVLVEMVETSLFRLATCSVVVVAEVEDSDPSLPSARSRIWGMEARIRAPDRMEVVMVSPSPPALVEAVIPEETMREAAVGETLHQELHRLEAAGEEAPGRMERSLKV